MIGFDALGELGRLGNQMFQYAALRGIGARRGFEVCIPPLDRHELASCFRLPHRPAIGLLGEAAPTVAESDFHFDAELFDGCPDDVTLYGHFQCERYFQHIEASIREDFAFRDEIRERAETLLADWWRPGIAALHVRRGDYLTDPDHPSLPLDYYEMALAEIDSALVLVFSDEPDWCAEQQLFADRRRFRIVASGDAYVDLCLMSRCERFVIANSSFSWWGAWLSRAPGKRVVGPRQWFGAELARLSTDDLFPPGWLRI